MRRTRKRGWVRDHGPATLNIYVGDMDDYYLNNAVYLAEEFLKSTSDPPYGGEVDFGDRAEHCWNGDHTRPNATSRLRYSDVRAQDRRADLEIGPSRHRPGKLAVLIGSRGRECGGCAARFLQ